MVRYCVFYRHFNPFQAYTNFSPRTVNKHIWHYVQIEKCKQKYKISPLLQPPVLSPRIQWDLLVLQTVQYQHKYRQATCTKTGVLRLHVCSKLMLDGSYKEIPVSSRTSGIQDLGLNTYFSLEEKDTNSASSLTFSSLLSEISGYFWRVGGVLFPSFL